MKPNANNSPAQAAEATCSASTCTACQRNGGMVIASFVLSIVGVCLGIAALVLSIVNAVKIRRIRKRMVAGTATAGNKRKKNGKKMKECGKGAGCDKLGRLIAVLKEVQQEEEEEAGVHNEDEDEDEGASAILLPVHAATDTATAISTASASAESAQDDK
mmetsp:Transcript_3685/g.8327  ORF Transcript_3685/g.8327 Transcript_3685/m.8327 type:complete len:160 (+) Transcript_3685:162-641(+)|eukprot:CAMPEP_0178499120 /NCGR_PEP_ID=MMETSP0696-20121128/15649_1 /TAXON_ID=265572 /ORGANISM="Extubocellulus spinifer, Strain CCMP396" /LENGTH=159 /DNA_ID=CAMNT_0020127785 /DNA_START=127 /DNA_END=606 /DNA_ORIENTATION=+